MSSWAIAAVAAGLTLSACGSGARQDVGEPSGTFHLQVSQASFPASQRLAEHTKLVITVQNTGNATIPNVAVTILNPNTGTRYATSAGAFSELLATQAGLASRSRPVWVIDQPPGPCTYSCQSGGPGGAVTAYSNTWALGKLAPEQKATFVWGVTAVKPGKWDVRYEVAAGLNGKAKAVDSNGQPPSGTFHVTISPKPRQAYVTNSGQVVNSP